MESNSLLSKMCVFHIKHSNKHGNKASIFCAEKKKPKQVTLESVLGLLKLKVMKSCILMLLMGKSE